MNAKAKAKAKPEAKPYERGSSESGYHFITLFLTCRRKWYFRHVMGLLERFEAPPLLFGRAFHEAKMLFYRKRDTKVLLPAFLSAMHHAKNLFADQEEYHRRTERGKIMLTLWLDEFGKRDLKLYTIHEVEKELSARLPNGFIVTGRLDLVIEDRQGIFFPVDTKTSSFSTTLTRESMTLGDQATTYLYLEQKNFPERRIGGLIVDISYWNDNSNRPSNIINFRTDFITRSAYDTVSYELYTMDALQDIANRMKALETGKYEPVQLFGRNTNECFSYHQHCPYIDICRTDIRPADCPKTFIREPSKDLKRLKRMSADFDLRRYGIEAMKGLNVGPKRNRRIDSASHGSRREPRSTAPAIAKRPAVPAKGVRQHAVSADTTHALDSHPARVRPLRAAKRNERAVHPGRSTASHKSNAQLKGKKA